MVDNSYVGYAQNYPHDSWFALFRYGLLILDFTQALHGYLTSWLSQWKCNNLDKSGVNLGIGSANERRRYIVTSSLIGWAHIQNMARSITWIRSEISYNHNKTKLNKIFNWNYKNKDGNCVNDGIYLPNPWLITHARFTPFQDVLIIFKKYSVKFAELVISLHGRGFTSAHTFKTSAHVYAHGITFKTIMYTTIRIIYLTLKALNELCESVYT